MCEIDDLLPVLQPHANREKKADIGFPIRHEVADEFERIVLQINNVKADIFRRVDTLDTIGRVDHAWIVVYADAPFNQRSDLVNHAALVATEVQNGLAMDINRHRRETH